MTRDKFPLTLALSPRRGKTICGCGFDIGLSAIPEMDSPFQAFRESAALVRLLALPPPHGIENEDENEDEKKLKWVSLLAAGRGGD